MIWYKRVGFYSNPFSIKPAAFHDEVIGQNLKKVMEKVDEGGFIFVKGDYGTGKTTVLKRIINRYKGKGKLIYISLEFLEEVKVKQLLRKRANLFQKVFGRLPREAILLVDESQLMKKSISEDIYDFFDKGFVKSVVFVGTRFNKKQFSSEVVKALKGNMISLSVLTSQHAVKIVRKRIGDVLLLDKIIKEIFSYSKNPRTFLENCEDVCKYVIDIYASKADSKHVKAVLGKKKVGKKRRKRIIKKEVKREEKLKENKENKAKEEKKVEFYVDTEEYPEYTFKQEF